MQHLTREKCPEFPSEVIRSLRRGALSTEIRATRTRSYRIPDRARVTCRVQGQYPLSHSATADGKTLIRGKAWPTGEAEPEAWPIDRVDPIPNKQGSPGLFADALRDFAS